MKLFRTHYDDSYFNSIFDIKPVQYILNLITKQKAQLVKSFHPNGNLLEIGCSEGKLLYELQNDFDIMGIDISKQAIKRASRLVSYKKLKIMDIEKEYLEGKYDLIVAFDILEHLRNPKQAMIKIKKALKRNGIFIFSVPNNYGFFGKLSTKILNFLDRTHVSTFERSKWINLTKNLSFSLEIMNQTFFGFFKSDFSKHFSFNLIIIVKK